MGGKRENGFRLPETWALGAMLRTAVGPMRMKTVSNPDFTCTCQAETQDIETLREPDGRIPLEELTALRQRCLALREIFLPDEIWPHFREWHALPDDVAAHSSIVLLAYRRGYLPRLTAPVHHYLTSSDGILPCVSKQYLTDLREKWMFSADPLERNRLCRTFQGRLVELQFALRLESQSHKIVGLEAIRKGPDIETLSNQQGATAFEVKFLGVEDGDFRVLLNSMSGHPAGRALSPYMSINYMLLRLYEAARQLRKAIGRKTAVIVIDELSWFRFDMQIKDNWVDWRNPGVIGLDENNWRPLLALLRDASDLPSGLGPTIRELDSVQIFTLDSAFEFRLKKEVNLR